MTTTRRMPATLSFTLSPLLLAGCSLLESPPSLPMPHETPAPVRPATPTLPGVEASDPRLAVFKPALPAEFAATTPSSDAKVTLGRMLYHDKRLSKNHDVSCASCHDLAKYGVDGLATSLGHRGQRGTRNAPSVFNAAGHFAQFWDGRAKDVEEQAAGPITNPVEMAMPDAVRVEQTLRSIPVYVDLFKKAYPQEKQPVTLARAAGAIAAFERKLVTPARWDQFLTGNNAALTPDEKSGLATFLQVGCQTCHAGSLVGGNLYQRLGLVAPWPAQKDEGRYSLTKNEADRLFFKVPSLRNIEKTAPYFHDGSVAQLETAVRMMAQYQLGKTLTDAETQSLLAFLRALTGTLPASLLASPDLPASTAKTPKPDPA